jgi:ribonuclease HI
MIEVFTDGACSGNPGPGGWGVLIVKNDEFLELSGGDGETTNNRMEMRAVIEALKATANEPAIRIYTDSQYVKNGINDWIKGWKRNGWKTAARKPVKNQDLWRALDDLLKGRKVEWRWVKGHAGHPGNERADALARMGCAASLR